MTKSHALLGRTIFFCVLASCSLFSQAAWAAAAPSLGPSQWPETSRATPIVEAWPNGIRISGADRYQTSLAALLALRGEGGFPYSTPDPSSGGAESLESASKWWGLDRCPRSVILVAGDAPADGLVAASLSDPSGKSTEPYLRRTASADPLFDPVGSYDRVDTFSAPIVLTPSSRNGANKLAISAKLALKDMRTGGCRTARDVIVVGGDRAVPAGVESEILALGYRSVFRIAGEDRYATAAIVAESLGTSPVPEGIERCFDALSSDGAEMRFYANSVVEFRESADQCELLSRTVVLVDGVTGADALAAAWWTGFWQVPVLFHDGSQLLPESTALALETMTVHNLIVLGGEERIPRSAVVDAIQVTGAATLRLEGQDRYATSVAMARYLGGWWPSGVSFDSSGATLCIAASAGEAARSIGWSDALVAGPFCGVATSLPGSPAPARAVGPVNGLHPQLLRSGSKASRSASPILLVRPGAANISMSTQQFLQGMFPAADKWCSSSLGDGGCADPGFVIGFGGEELISDATMTAISAILGGQVSNGERLEPQNEGAFVTGLSMTPVFRQGDSTAIKMCYPRNGYDEARWISAGLQGVETPEVVVDAMSDRWFLEDFDGVGRSKRSAAPGCLGFDISAGQDLLWSRTSGLDGRSAAQTRFDIRKSGRTTLGGYLTSSTVNQHGSIDSIPLNVGDGLISLSFSSSNPGVVLHAGSKSSAVLQWNLYLEIRYSQPLGTSPHGFEASFVVATETGLVEANATGEALFSNGIWFLRGSTTTIDGSATQAGGFWLDLYTAESSIDDDRAIWRFDLFRRPHPPLN